MTRQIRLALRAYGVGGPGQHSLWKDPRIPKNASIDIDWYIAQAKAAEHDLQLAVQRGPTLRVARSDQPRPRRMERGTSLDAGTSKNYGLDEPLDYATRYGRALEHVNVDA
jgi:hypothetical protein